MKAIILYNTLTKQKLSFRSLAIAARTLGIKYGILRYDLMTRGAHGNYILSDDKADAELDHQRVELHYPYSATINGKQFVAVKCNDKTHCTKCDIYKLDPPSSWIQSPLCYEHTCGKRKIVDICARYKCIWRRKKND